MHFLASPMRFFFFAFLPPFKSLLYTFSWFFCLHVCLNFPHFRRTVQKQGCTISDPFLWVKFKRWDASLRVASTRTAPIVTQQRGQKQSYVDRSLKEISPHNAFVAPINQVRGSCVYSPSSVWRPQASSSIIVPIAPWHLATTLNIHDPPPPPKCPVSNTHAWYA